MFSSSEKPPFFYRDNHGLVHVADHAGMHCSNGRAVGIKRDDRMPYGTCLWCVSERGRWWW